MFIRADHKKHLAGVRIKKDPGSYLGLGAYILPSYATNLNL